MTEGVDVPQTTRTNIINGSITHLTRSRADAIQCPEKWSGTSSSHLSDTVPVQDQEHCCKLEDQDNQEGASSSLHEGLQCHIEVAGEQHSGHLAPDGGWGWAVLTATILVLALTLAFPSCIGIFYTDLQKEFQASNSETSWVPAIMTAVLHAGGPVCSILVESFGCRTTIMLGGILSGLGMVVSSFAQKMADLYISTGVITGLGFCLCFQPSVTMVGHYFVRRRAFASALSSTGTALGLSTLPLLANFLLGQFGWRGSFLILGGVVLNCCVCGAVMRPLHTKRKVKAIQIESVHPLLKTNGLLAQQEHKRLKGHLQSTLSKMVPFMYRHMAIDLIRTHPRFLVYALGVSWMMLGFLVPLVYLVPYATAHGIEQERAALLMAVLGLVNVTVRPTAALLFGLKRFRGSHHFIYVFACALLVNGLSNCVCAAVTDFQALLSYVLVFAASMSIVGSLLYTVLMETVEMSRFQSALGLISIMESVMLLLGPPLAGLLADFTGQYSYVFLFCSVSVSTAGLFIMVSFYWLDRQCSKKEKRSFSEHNYNLKPSISLATDVEGNQLPLQKKMVQDTGTATNV
ncbi:monocarboxylate transporter 6 [Tachysurus fulvidraco]|uniref:monocarboxylate transporter 6 n=1 Tax=Tachysurus fulvidraco TaxID=1234273 RepID=UPI001FEEB92E|nr:monocarboxylate transporter 6 [Tachysurus fulvidraco]